MFYKVIARRQMGRNLIILYYLLLLYYFIIIFTQAGLRRCTNSVSRLAISTPLCSVWKQVTTLRYSTIYGHKYEKKMNKLKKSVDEIYSRVVRASDCQCQSRQSPGLSPSILRHSGILGAAENTMKRCWMKVQQKSWPKKLLKKNIKTNLP